jgi:hypothetical protein
MASNAWKKYELWLAREIFDTERNSLSGGNNRSDDGTKRRGDIIDQTGVLNVEAKNHKNPTVNKWFRKAEEEVENKSALLFVHKKRRPYMKSSVTMSMEDFLLIKDELIEKLQEKYNEEENNE